MEYNLTSLARRNGLLGIISNTGNTTLGSINIGQTVLRVYDTAMPTASTVAAWTVANVPANPLVSFSLSSMAVVTANGAGFSGIAPVAAIKTGTAVWFVIYNGSGTAMIVGDVSTLAGTAGLRMSSLDIVLGQTYGMQNLTFTLPSNYVF